jgi:hypothetical protein
MHSSHGRRPRVQFSPSLTRGRQHALAQVLHYTCQAKVHQLDGPALREEHVLGLWGERWVKMTGYLGEAEGVTLSMWRRRQRGRCDTLKYSCVTKITN